MGRKRWWKVGLELLVLCFFQTAVRGDGEVGCLFSKNVCRSGMETCYDDLAFGRCVQLFVEPNDEDVYRYDLDASELELLRERLQDLVIGGYEWSHPYTQCIMQGSLYSLRYKLTNDLVFCRKLERIDNRRFDVYEEEEEEPREESKPFAVVNFTPTRGRGYGDFANEKYYPPASSPKQPKHNRRPLNDDSEDAYNYVRSSFRKKPSRQRLPNLDDIIVDDENPIDNDSPINSPEHADYVDANYDLSSKNFRELAQRLDVNDERPMYRLRRQQQNDKKFLRSFDRSPFKLDDYVDSSRNVFREDDRESSKAEDENREWGAGLDDYIWKFTKNGLSAVNETSPLDEKDDMEDLVFLRNDEDGERDGKNNDRWMSVESGDEDDAEEDETKSETGKSSFQNRGALDRPENRPEGGMYTEGGLVRPLDIRDAIRQVSVPDDIVFDDDLLMWSRDLAAFQRNERLDVKKPGPLFSTNNYAFKTHSPSAHAANNDPSPEYRTENDQIPRLPLTKKKTSDDDEAPSYGNVDVDHVYIKFHGDFTNWEDGEKVVEEVARLLGYSPDVFSGVRVGRAEVTFKVNDESPNDAHDIAPKIYGIREELRKNTGRMLRCAGVGDKVKLPPSVEVEMAPRTMSTGVFGAIVAAGGAAVAAAAVVTLIIARKHAKSRAKLAGLATPDPEASKDYQDLCRARMQAKQPNEKPESPRIISLSRESESNRSSTSSWGEEAAALTNMDIATGHMVLSYMEDHLKNKDRLDQEWAGICAYEADPSSMAVATDKSNADRNRPGAVLPYNHSRVVLNDLSNAVNSDYINASTITDHDPRNPAYIATQGPLPQTAADFWQLVWEQGSVVIVMLTRLTEEGRGMCHRYWPDEGSELYNIYEVHLVSEHIWCDDYLVRSFYLKNLRTGETRTVTQFHFLSWPENGVPLSTKALLEFRRKVNKSYRGRSCPIVVHCSDGAGRTGTYCLIDMVLNRMAKGAKEIDIAAALEHIRDQRPGMVATKQQFEFVFGAVAEEVHAILKALPVQQVAEKSQAPGIPTNGGQSSSTSDQ